jgi:hypothetical protein
MIFYVHNKNAEMLNADIKDQSIIVSLLRLVRRLHTSIVVSPILFVTDQYSA